MCDVQIRACVYASFISVYLCELVSVSISMYVVCFCVLEQGRGPLVILPHPWSPILSFQGFHPLSSTCSFRF